MTPRAPLSRQSSGTPGRVCQGCGTDLPPKTRPGRDRKWCSDRCRKLTLYARPCLDCGTPVNVDGRVANAAVRCNPCDGLSRVRWTRETVVAAIERWGALYGVSPSANEWNATLAREAGDTRYESGDWPTIHTVQRVFGSWNAGIEAAGFVARPVGVRKAVARAV